MLLDGLSILEIRKSGAKLLHKAAQNADRGQWLLAQMRAATAIEILRAAGMLMNDNREGFDILALPHVKHVLVRNYSARDSSRARRRRR